MATVDPHHIDVEGRSVRIFGENDRLAVRRERRGADERPLLEMRDLLPACAVGVDGEELLLRAQRCRRLPKLIASGLALEPMYALTLWLPGEPTPRSFSGN
jgi:hypothetical protein